ncbi:MAG: CheB methylesterase [Gemmatimonadetes bacterium]|jgi:two-component system chemotaxis response regulator CheB|nr:CheB methylesterase [Gemmatimonadota bacterium]
MAGHDIIVIGGSAGSIEALSSLLAGLPADLPAAVCVVLHQSAFSPNRRPEIFGRVSPLPVVLAEQGMRLRPGTVYLAAPDMHLHVERSATAELGTLRLVHGPKENRARPSVDPLFRTAALAFGRRVIGVILSGSLDDGVSGLWVVKDRGGVAVVQDPEDSAVSSMPAHAIQEVAVDHVAPAAELGALIGRLARQALTTPAMAHAHHHHDDAMPRSIKDPAELEREVAISALDDEAHERSERYGVPSRFACPDCGGVLWAASPPGTPLHFRCETGHAYSAAHLAEAQSEAVEAAMWAALRALEDKTELARLRAGLARERGFPGHAQQFEVQMQAALEHAAAIRALLRMDGSSGIRPSALSPGAERGPDLGGVKPARSSAEQAQAEANIRRLEQSAD